MLTSFTNDDLGARMRMWFESAKVKLAESAEPRSDSSTGLQPQAVVILPNGDEQRCPMPWRNNSEKFQWGAAVSYGARMVAAQALVITVVVNCLNYEPVAKDLGLKSPHDIDPQEFQRRVLRWCEMKTGGREFSKLPRRFRHDALMVYGMGPGLHDMMLQQAFEWRDGKLTWTGNIEETNAKGAEYAKFNVVPPWWD
jgi:hypothetical protein